jgi:aminoglycoside phosphotransferase family enzyme/predicted kinase
VDHDIVTGLAEALGTAGRPAELRETHMSWVLLTEDRAYKLKKPVRFDFLDLREPDARRRACEAEVDVNQALAADVVLGVRAVVPAAAGYELAPEGETGDAVDWVVEMRLFDEDATMAAAVTRGTLRAQDVAATARRIAGFHALAERRPGPGWSRIVADAWMVNLDELGRVAGADLDAARLAVARGFAESFAARRAEELDRRAADGLVVDGHGDLRAEHVLPGDGAVTIVDRLEFDPALRRVDVADDLAFLVMDLHALGAGWAAEVLVDAYRDAGGDPGDDALVAAFAVYRAQVRAKVGLLRAAQVEGAAATAARDGALRLVALAERLAWTARGPLALVVAGPPASGKSTVAHALGDAGAIPVLSSDDVRREALGVPAGEPAPAGAYTPEARRRIYAALGERAARALRSGSVVVDATFGDAGQRDAFLTALGAPERERLRLVVCEAPEAVRVERARRRAAVEASASDAGPEVVRSLPGDSVGLPVAAGHRLTVDTTVVRQDLARCVARWLDAP